MKSILLAFTLMTSFYAQADMVTSKGIFKCKGSMSSTGDKVLCNGVEIFAEKPSGKMRIIKSSDECSNFISANGVISCDGQPAQFEKRDVTNNKVPKECYLLQTGFIGCSDLKRSSSPHRKCCRFEDVESPEAIYKDHGRFNDLLEKVFIGLDEVTLPASTTK